MRTKPRKKIFIIFLVFPFCLLAFDPAKNLKFYKEIIPSDSNSDIFQVVLDSEIYRSADEAFNNIRILNSQCEDIPFSIEILRETKMIAHAESVPAKIAKANKNGNSLELMVELPSARNLREIRALQIHTTAKNFEKEISVEASDDKQTWLVLLSSESIFDYSEFIPLSKTSVQLPSCAPKPYYRLKIANFAEGKKSPRIELINEKRGGSDFSSIEKISINTELLKIDSISFLAVKEEISRGEEKIFEYQPLEFKTEENESRTDLVFSTRREPLKEAILKTGSANFARSCNVFASDDGKNWELISSDEKICSIETSSFKDSNLRVGLDGRRAYYKISILNGNSPPIKVNGAKLYGCAHVLNFIASKQNGKLRVYYGGDGAPPPKYDAGEVISRMKNPSFLRLALSEEKINPLYSGKMRMGNFFENKILFYGALALMLLCLSAIIYKSFKKIDLLPPES